MKLSLLFLFLGNLGFANYVGNPQAPELPKIISYTRDICYDEQYYWLNAKLDYEKEYMHDMNLKFNFGGSEKRVQFANFNGIT